MGTPSLSPNATPVGKVVAVVRRNWRLLCGVIDENSAERAIEGNAQNVFFLPVDRRIPRIRLRTRQAKSLMGKRVAIAIDSWLRTSRYPTGHFVRTIGDIGDRETETEVILLEHDVAFSPFSSQVLKCLPSEGENYSISPEQLASREDLRNLDICSIDPPGCTDIDDALHCRRLPNGNFEVGVRGFSLWESCCDYSASS
jgi:exosome complex exonuclease DIS3/RRP44